MIDPYFTTAFRLITSSDWLVRQILDRTYGPDRPAISDTQVDDWQRPFRVSGSEQGFRGLLHSTEGVSLDDLRRLRVPRIVVWGQHDTVDPLSAGRTSAQALGAKMVVIPRAGHLSMLGEPAGVAGVIAAFAARIDRLARSQSKRSR